MPYTPILATLGYVLSPDRDQVLLVHRNARAHDAHLGKYNGLGGKLEADEDIVAGMRREIREEAQIDCNELQLRGTISWPGFGKHGEDWFGFVFLITRFQGVPPASNPEGNLEWVPIERIMTATAPSRDSAVTADRNDGRPRMITATRWPTRNPRSVCTSSVRIAMR